MRMNTNRTVLKCFLLLSAFVELSVAFTAPPCPTGRHVTRGIATSNNANVVGLGLFRPHSKNQRSCDNDQQRTAPKVSRFVRRISHKLNIIRSVVSSRLSGGKQRFLSILAAAIIAVGACPSHVIAETPVNPPSMTKVVVASIRTSMDSKSMTKNSFLQYNTKAPSNYVEDVAASDHIFDTTLSAPVEEIDGAVESETTIVENVRQVITAEDTLQADEGLMILNDKMVKTAAKNIAIIGGTATAGLALNRKVARRTTSAGEMGVQTDVEDAFETIVPSGSDTTTNNVASREADSGSLLPLTDRQYVQARKQPKSQREEAALAAKYAAIETLEERAYQILVDLGMVEVR